MTAMTDLSNALTDGACLIDSTGPAASLDLRIILINRLSRYYARLGSQPNSPLDSQTLEDIELTTAREALAVVTRVQGIIGKDVPADSPTDHVPLIGTRDLAEIRTLLSIGFKWGLNPLLAKAMVAWTRPTATEEERKTTAGYYEHLRVLVTDLLGLIFPGGTGGQVAQSLITTTILEKHGTDLVKACLTLGWLPRSMSSELIQALDIARPLTERILNLLPPSQAMTVLGAIMTVHPLLKHVRKTCARFLSRQLLRPQGVQGLCGAVFGEEESSSEAPPVEKLEHVARVLTTVPTAMNAEEYFNLVIPRVIEMLSQDSWANKLAASYTISRILSTDGSFQHKELGSRITLSILHLPFYTFTEDQETGLALPNTAEALSTLITLVSNADPSPTLISGLLSPIASILYSLLHHMDKVKTSEPGLKDSLRGLLITWGKIVEQPEGTNILWSLLGNEEGRWKTDEDGIHKYRQLEKDTSLSLLTTPEEFDLDSDIFELYPNGNHFVLFVKDIDRPDIASELFSRLLEGYRELEIKGAEGDSLKTLLYLQIIVQMQTHLTDRLSLSNLLHKPTHILSFINNALHPVHQQTQHQEDESDSDDDTPGALIISSNDEIIETSLNLLLSTLEANENLSASTEPILNDIYSSLEPLARNGSATVAPLAREARIVLTARLASTSTPVKSHVLPQEEENAQLIYQKALKLLQDPILPVRAHGLLLLRELVTPTSSNGPKVDPALVPAILSIFLQSIQDDDSYLFLNAVQGLAALVDTFGKDVMRGLMNEYAQGLSALSAPALTQHDLDIRVRVGEALASAIRRCGGALGIYVNLLIPPLLDILRSPYIPTVLRMSSISLLSECIKTNYLAMLPYVTNLTSAMIDLLQTETVPLNPRSSIKDSSDKPTIETKPTSDNPKFPALRRAAIHLIQLVIREITQQAYDSPPQDSVLPPELIRRAQTTLSYVASVDEDGVVQVMAREAAEALHQLSQALFGFT